MNADAPALSAMMLADELTRCASVAARHLSHAEHDEARGHAFAGGSPWRVSAERHELRFLALVDEARRRLDAGDTELERSLALYTWGPSLVAR